MNQPTPSTPHRFLLLTALLVGACQWSQTPPSAPAPRPAPTAPQDLDDVNIGSFSAAIDYGPYLVAKSKGWFEEALKPLGAEPQYTTFQSLAPINESFATGRVDVVFEAEPPAIIGRAAGTDIRIVAIGCTLAQEVIVPANSKTARIADLKGKKVAVLAGTSSHYGLLKIARAAGLQDSELTVVDMIPPDAKAAFETDQVAGWAVWPPWVEQELVINRARVLPGSNAQINSIMAVRGGLATAHPDRLKVVVSTVERAKTWLRDNPEEGKALLAKELGIDRKVVDLAWPKHDWSAQLTPEIRADIQAKSDFLLQTGMIKTPVSAADLIQPLDSTP